MIAQLFEVFRELLVLQHAGAREPRTPPPALGLDELEQPAGRIGFVTGDLDLLEEHAVAFRHLELQDRLPSVLINTDDRLDFRVGVPGLLVQLDHFQRVGVRLAFVENVAGLLAGLAAQPVFLELLFAFEQHFLDRRLAADLIDDLHAIGRGLLQHAHVEEVAGLDQVADVLLDQIARARLADGGLDVGENDGAVDRLGAVEADFNLADDRCGFLRPGLLLNENCQ